MLLKKLVVSFEKRVLALLTSKIKKLSCLQETKLPFCNDFFCSSLWGNSSHVFSFRPSVGASRGLLTIWDTTEVEVWSSVSREHVMWCHDRFYSSGEEFHVTNVYAPSHAGAK
jgi:hypothetical protein